MTPRARVVAALRGERTDRVPFTVYDSLITTSEAERRLRNDGLCIILRSPPIYRVRSPNIRQTRTFFREPPSDAEDSADFIRTTVHTPNRDLWALERLGPGDTGASYVDHLFKGPEDYQALESLIRDRIYRPNHQEFAGLQESAGDDCFVLADIGYEPLHEIIYELMGIQRFSVEWTERQDEVLRLYDVLVEDRRKRYAIAADSPALAVNYGGNVSAETLGLDRFLEYHVPNYLEFSEILHARGKLLGLHLDANNRLLAQAIADSGVDFLEGFTPDPDSDMTVSEARAAWPGKVLWLNFPPSIHLSEPHAIEDETRHILQAAAPGERFLMGITEGVPRERWQKSYAAISRAIAADGGLPIKT